MINDVAQGKKITSGPNLINPEGHLPPDEQDTAPLKAPKGKTTDHQKRRKKPGPKPRRRHMPNPRGRYPTSSALKKHIETVRHHYVPASLAEKERKTRYYLDVLSSIGAPNAPEKVKEEHILVLLDWMVDNNISPETERKVLRFLDQYFSFYGNGVISVMRNKKLFRNPGSNLNNITSLSETEADLIHEASKQLEGWDGSVARFVTKTYLYTGLRPSELRTLKFKDVNIHKGTITVSHPKGEGKYGVHRTVGILTLLEEAFQQFLDERKDYLEHHGLDVDVEPLIPRVAINGKKRAKYWHYNEWWKLKAAMIELSGVKFKWKDYRATFCQWAIDRGATVAAVSRIMGHSSTVITERFYGRIRNDVAIDEIERAFTEPKPQNGIPLQLGGGQ